MAETFFATLKTELVYRHSRLGNLSPTDHEQQLVTQEVASA
ncbi:hypothetical protein ACH9DO_04365 [Kocuria sp. M1N1S27]